MVDCNKLQEVQTNLRYEFSSRDDPNSNIQDQDIKTYTVLNSKNEVIFQTERDWIYQQKGNIKIDLYKDSITNKDYFRVTNTLYGDSDNPDIVTIQYYNSDGEPIEFDATLNEKSPDNTNEANYDPISGMLTEGNKLSYSYKEALVYKELVRSLSKERADEIFQQIIPKLREQWDKAKGNDFDSFLEAFNFVIGTIAFFIGGPLAIATTITTALQMKRARDLEDELAELDVKYEEFTKNLFKSDSDTLIDDFDIEKDPFDYMAGGDIYNAIYAGGELYEGGHIKGIIDFRLISTKEAFLQLKNEDFWYSNPYDTKVEHTSFEMLNKQRISHEKEKLNEKLNEKRKDEIDSLKREIEAYKDKYLKEHGLSEYINNLKKDRGYRALQYKLALKEARLNRYKYFEDTIAPPEGYAAEKIDIKELERRYKYYNEEC